MLLQIIRNSVCKLTSRLERDGMRAMIIGVLATVAGIPGPVQAQEPAIAAAPDSSTASDPSTTDPDPDTIVVTASRSGTPLERLPISVTVIDDEALAQQLDYNTNILRAIEFAAPGLSPQGDGRTGCFLGIRGRQTSVQINGIPVNQDLRQSNCNAMFQISPFAIERIEVVRGGTALFGAGAPGGIINLMTRRAKGSNLEVDAVAQTSFNTSDWDRTFSHDLYLGAGQDLGGWDYYVGAAYSDAGARRTPDGGFVPFRTYESVALNGSVGADVLGGEFRATATYYREEPDEEYGADGTQRLDEKFGNVGRIEDHPQIANAYDRLTTLALSYRHPEVLTQELTLSLFYQDQRYRQRDNFYDSTFGNFFFATDTDNQRLGFRSTLVKRMNLGALPTTLSYGLDYTRNRFYRPIIEPANGNQIVGFVSPEITLNTYAAFAQGEVELGRARITGGVRQEWYRGEVGDRGFDPDIEDAVTPGDIRKSKLTLFNLGGVFDVTANVQLFGGFSQGAELSQLGRGALNAGDASLVSPEPATSDQFEAGIRGRTGPVRFEIAGFYSASDKSAELQADPSCAGETFCPLIPLRAPRRFHGFEASAEVAVTPRLDASAIVTWQRGKIFDEGLDRYIDYSTDVVAPFRVTGALGWRPLEGLRASLQGTYVGAADYFTPAEESFGRVRTQSQLLVDASLGYRIGPGELFVGASNLLDDDYVNVQNQGFGFDFFYYQAEGRRVTAGYKARF